jgi:hypothetical protein
MVLVAIIGLVGFRPLSSLLLLLFRLADDKGEAGLRGEDTEGIYESESLRRATGGEVVPFSGGGADSAPRKARCRLRVWKYLMFGARCSKPSFPCLASDV